MFWQSTVSSMRTVSWKTMRPLFCKGQMTIRMIWLNADFKKNKRNKELKKGANEPPFLLPCFIIRAGAMILTRNAK